MTTIQNANDLLKYLVEQSMSTNKNWYSFSVQRVIGIYACYEIAKNHADKMTPDEIANYVVELNNAIFKTLVDKKVNG